MDNNSNFNMLGRSLKEEQQAADSQFKQKQESANEAKNLLYEGISTPFIEAGSLNLLSKAVKFGARKAGMSEEDIESLQDIGQSLKDKDFGSVYDKVRALGRSKAEKVFSDDQLNFIKDKFKNVKSIAQENLEKTQARLTQKAEDIKTRLTAKAEETKARLQSGADDARVKLTQTADDAKAKLTQTADDVKAKADEAKAKVDEAKAKVKPIQDEELFDKPTMLDAGTGKPIIPQKPTIQEAPTDIEPTTEDLLRQKLDTLDPDTEEYKQLARTVLPQAEDRAVSEFKSPLDAIQKMIKKPVSLEADDLLSNTVTKPLYDPSKLGVKVMDFSKADLPDLPGLDSVKPSLAEPTIEPAPAEPIPKPSLIEPEPTTAPTPKPSFKVDDDVLKYTFKQRKEVIRGQRKVQKTFDNKLSEHQQNTFNEEYAKTKQPNIPIDQEGSYERSIDNLQNANEAMQKAKNAPELDPNAEPADPNETVDPDAAPKPKPTIDSDFSDDAIKGLTEGVEVDADLGGPEDILGDIVAVGAGLATLFGGLSHHSNNTAPPVLQANLTQQLGTSVA